MNAFSLVLALLAAVLLAQSPALGTDLTSSISTASETFGSCVGDCDTPPTWLISDERVCCVSTNEKSTLCPCCVGNEENQCRESCLDHILPRSNLCLPMLKELAGERASQLPLPLGLSAVFTELDRNVAVSDVRLGIGNAAVNSVNRVAVPETTFHASSRVGRVDLWLLPCLNVYGIVGHTRTTGNVVVTVSNFPLPTSSPVNLNIPVELEGPTAGFGGTAAIGAGCVFGSLDFNQTWTNFSNLNSSLTAIVITPRVGIIVDRDWFKGELHVGAMWQDTAQTVELTIDHPTIGNGLNVQVDQFEPSPWNFLVGGLWAIDERIHLLVEGGMGGRSYIISGVTLRF